MITRVIGVGIDGKIVGVASFRKGAAGQRRLTKKELKKNGAVSFEVSHYDDIYTNPDNWINDYH